MIARRLLAPTLLIALGGLTGAASAQSPFPSVGSPASGSTTASPFPSVGHSAAPPAQSSSFPAVNSGAPAFPSVNGSTRAALPSAPAAPQGGMGAAPMSPGFSAAPPSGDQEECMKQVASLRDEAQKRAKLIQEAGKRHAPPQEACKLIGNFSQAEVRFMNFVTTKQAACHVPPEVPKQMREAHAKTEKLLKQVCAAANAPQRAAGPSLSDVIGSPVIPDEDTSTKRKGGSTFDTLSGNVLSR